MTPDLFAKNTSHLTNLQSVHLLIEPYWDLERPFPNSFPSWLAAFTSVSILSVAFNIGTNRHKKTSHLFDENVQIVNERAGTEAVRNVVLGDDLPVYGTYYNLVLRWEAGKGAMMDFSAPNPQEQMTCEWIFSARTYCKHMAWNQQHVFS